MDRGRSTVDGALVGALGLPLPAVTAVTEVVRTDVAATVRRLLPGQAPPGLGEVAARLVEEAPRLVRAARPELGSGQATAAALPGLLVHVLAADVARRTDEGGPEPSAELRAAYQATGQRLALTDPAGEIRTLGLALADPVEADRTGTGWALLAAALALDEHADRLPVPGRERRRPRRQQEGAAQAGSAYHFGRRLTAATALALLET